MWALSDMLAVGAIAAAAVVRGERGHACTCVRLARGSRRGAGGALGCGARGAHRSRPRRRARSRKDRALDSWKRCDEKQTGRGRVRGRVRARVRLRIQLRFGVKVRVSVRGEG